MDNLSANLRVIVSACQKVSRFMLRDFGEIEQLQSSVNGAENFALASKTKIEKILIENLLESRPKYGILSENQEIKGSDISHRFIINVSDGFENYSRGLPFFSISVAIQEQKNLVASVIYNPVLDKMYYAEKGSGTFVSESRMTRRIRVSSRRELFNSSVIESGNFAYFSNANILTFGSVGLAFGYVASGMSDVFVGYSKNVFDLASGFLIIKEAGGFIRAYTKDGNESEEMFNSDIVVCGNSYLQSEIKSCIMKKQLLRRVEMKKFILFFIGFISSISSVFAKDYRLNLMYNEDEKDVVAKNSNKRLNFELMAPVKLKNPEKKDLGLEAGGPKYFVLKEVKPVVKKKDVAPRVLEVVDVVSVSNSVPEKKENEVVKEEKVELSVVAENEQNPVINIPVDNTELKEKAPFIEDNSQVDKNIDEAKKLLNIAEKLANAVIDEEEPALIVEKTQPVDIDNEKPRFVITFAKDIEELKKADEKKMSDIIPVVKENSDLIVKIISYYSENSGRNLAFSRLLNARKILLENNVPTSQIIIMVMEDDDKSVSKDNTIEVFFTK